MSKRFRVVEQGTSYFWFEYTFRNHVYHGFYDCVELQMEERVSDALFERIERECDKYVYGEEDDEDVC